MSIRHNLTFNIISDSALITFYIISIHHYFPLNVMSHSASTVFNLMSFHHHFLYDVFSFQLFFTIEYSSDDLLSHLTLCALTFFYRRRFLLWHFVSESNSAVKHENKSYYRGDFILLVTKNSFASTVWPSESHIIYVHIYVYLFVHTAI
jgi:hypothetical protein